MSLKLPRLSLESTLSTKSFKTLLESSVAISLRQWFRSKTGNERSLIILSAILGSLMMISVVLVEINEKLSEQSDRYQQTLMNLDNIHQELKGYKSLLNQRREVEYFFRRVDDHQNPLSILEALFKRNLGDEARPRITETGTKTFGQQFRQTTLRVSDLRLGSIEKLLTLVNDLTTGQAPFLITHLTIDKNEGSGKLDVRLDLSTVSKGAVDPSNNDEPRAKLGELSPTRTGINS